MYLYIADFWPYIQPDQLNKLISNDESLRLAAQSASEAEAISYLIQRYDTSQEFTDTAVWSNSAATYTGASRVYLFAADFAASVHYVVGNLVNYQGNVYRCSANHHGGWNASNFTLIGKLYALFYAKYPKPLFDLYTEYKTGNEVYYKGKTYTCQANISGVFPDDATRGNQYWGTGTSYAIPAGTLPTNATYWQAGDNRSLQVLQCVVDITLFHLHSRLAPGNIPALRMERYDNAKEWLRMAGGQNDAITADIPLKQPTQGQRVRFGSNPKNVNWY